MTLQEIKATAARINYDRLFTQPGHRKVVIRAPKDKGGVYMTMTGFNGKTIDDALVYDYVTDNIHEQILSCHLKGMFIEVEPACCSLKG